MEEFGASGEEEEEATARGNNGGMERLVVMVESWDNMMECSRMDLMQKAAV